MIWRNNKVVWRAPGFELDENPFPAVRAIRGEIFRQVAERVTLRFEQQGNTYFLKYHRGVGWREIIKNLLFFRLPVLGAENEWRAIRLLEKQGVPTMRLAAYGQQGWNPAGRESFIITEELKPTVSLEDFFKGPEGESTGLAMKRRLIAEVAGMTRAMHRAGMNHRDLYICHFLLHTDKLAEGEVKLSLIDLHRAQLREQVPTRWLAKDLASLYFSALPARLSRRDELRFLKRYFDGPLRESLQSNRQQLKWIKKESERLQKKYLRKYAPDESTLK